MPQFKFARSHIKPLEGETKEQAEAREEAEAREAVMTFILGLTADPVPLKYISTPKGNRGAEVHGRQVLEKYNCAGCHQLRPGVYEFQIPDDPRQRDALLRRLDASGGADPADHLFESNAWKGRPSPVPGRLFVRAVEPRIDKGKTIALQLTEALRYTDAKGATQDIPAFTRIENLPLTDLIQTSAHSEPFGGSIFTMLIP